MAVITLQTLKLHNFKGIRSFVLDAQGADQSIYGDNATGKTTLRDAFSWLLFDKDSAGRKEFEIKTLDETGEPLHNLEHEVEGTLALGGRAVTLRKVFTEKWVKKRNTMTPEFSGHETAYYIDGVPVQKGEYTARVAAILPETMLKMLTDPAYFSEAMKWTERRQILLTVCGDVTDADVIASNPKLKDLPGILGTRKLEDHKKVVDSRRKEVNKELETLPVRIDEAERALPELPANKVALQNKLTDLRAKREAKQSEKIRIDAGGEVAEKQRAIRLVEAGMLDTQTKIRGESDRTLQQERGALNSINAQMDEKRREIRRLEADERDAAEEIKRLNAALESLRQQWKQVYESACNHSADTSCPFCGQALPADRVAEANATALATFNEDKGRKLEANNAEGRAKAARVKEFEAANTARRETITQLTAEVSGLEQTAARLDARISELRHAVPDFTQDTGYQALVAKKASLEQEIADLRAGTDQTRAAVLAAITELDKQIVAAEADLAKFAQREQGEARIRELTDQQKKLAGEWERLERELWLIEEFIRTKVSMLTSRINSRFKYATFKLFNQNINGGVEECCEVLYGGVPYTTALNTGARIVVGLDIINTLSEHYGFVAPIWIDNREAVTRLIPTRAQVISLVVSEPDKTLRVETARVLEREAV